MSARRRQTGTEANAVSAGDLALVVGRRAVRAGVRRPGRHAGAGRATRSARCAPRSPSCGRDRRRCCTTCGRPPPTPSRRWQQARADLERFDRVLGSAEAISDAVGALAAGWPAPTLSVPGDQGRRRSPTGTSAAPCAGCGGAHDAPRRVVRRRGRGRRRRRRRTPSARSAAAAEKLAPGQRRRRGAAAPCGARAPSRRRGRARGRRAARRSRERELRRRARRPPGAPQRPPRPGDEVLVDGEPVESGRVILMRRPERAE